MAPRLIKSVYISRIVNARDSRKTPLIDPTIDITAVSNANILSCKFLHGCFSANALNFAYHLPKPCTDRFSHVLVNNH